MLLVSEQNMVRNLDLINV